MVNSPTVCEKHCIDSNAHWGTRLIVVTGGPGAGKTAVLEMAKKVLCQNVAILPEAASIVFGGGFWRLKSISARIAAQSAIFHTQAEMEKLVIGEKKWAVGLCDRGTLDGLAYWPDQEETFWKMSNSTVELEYAKYIAVIHLRSPTDQMGYNQQNPLRIETAVEAKLIDDKIANTWASHPHYELIDNANNFLNKAQEAIRLISKFIPECCQVMKKCRH